MKLIEWEDRTYEVVTEDGAGECNGCDLDDGGLNCVYIQMEWMKQGLLKGGCREAQVVYKEVDPLYQDLLKVKEISDERNPHDTTKQ